MSAEYEQDTLFKMYVTLNEKQNKGAHLYFKVSEHSFI